MHLFCLFVCFKKSPGDYVMQVDPIFPGTSEREMSPVKKHLRPRSHIYDPCSLQPFSPEPLLQPQKALWFGNRMRSACFLMPAKARLRRLSDTLSIEMVRVATLPSYISSVSNTKLLNKEDQRTSGSLP